MLFAYISIKNIDWLRSRIVWKMITNIILFGIATIVFRERPIVLEEEALPVKWKKWLTNSIFTLGQRISVHNLFTI